MKSYAVIGANYGDEGKGLITDYLCRTRKIDCVVRFNGGAQAGHTVVAPDGTRHVFSHFGSGTLAGVPTFLSRFFVCNPALFFAEMERLPDGVKPTVVVDPNAHVTTPWDMLINQALEEKRGGGRHGSCGIGFGETIERGEQGYELTVGQLTMGHVPVWALMTRFAMEYFPQRCKELGILLDQDVVMRTVNRFVADCESFVDAVTVLDTRELRGKSVVFEGAQGLLLDQSHPNFPHVTRSNTGIHNAAILATEAHISDIEPIYVSRTYLTRHGAGPLPGEVMPVPDWVDDATNVDHPYQGKLRFAPLDGFDLGMRIHDDAAVIGEKPSLALTWRDVAMSPPELNGYKISYSSYGPTAEDVK